jgi:hypothetical protein
MSNTNRNKVFDATHSSQGSQVQTSIIELSKKSIS